MTPSSPIVQGFFDRATSTVSYVVHDGAVAAIIDPVLDYDPRAAQISLDSVTRLIGYLQEHELHVAWILETHAHADHLSAAQQLRRELGAPVAIGEHIAAVQEHFAPLFDVDPAFRPDGRQFDHLFRDGDSFTVGALSARVLHTPGHTPACVTYVIGDAAFVGDTLFMPDYGTARADFPGGDARTLYRSIRRILELPARTRLFMCHDYPPGGREPSWETTVEEQLRRNIMVRSGTSEEEFVRLRSDRDATLDTPALLLPSLQVNICAGHLPPAAQNGISYLKLPLNQLGKGGTS